MTSQAKTRDALVLAAQRLGMVLVILLLWQLVHAAGVLPSMVPSPIEVGGALAGLIASGKFWFAIGQTLGAALSGWAIAAVIAVALGLLIGTLTLLDQATSILIEFGRSFPVIAVLPVLVLIMGANARMETFLVAISCFWPILVQTVYGVRRQESAVTDTVRVFQLPSWLKFRRVLFPSALPFIATGLRVASSIAILVAIGTEILSQTGGVGRQITLAQEVSHWDVAFAYLFVAGLLGWLITIILSATEARALRWNRRKEN